MMTWIRSAKLNSCRLLLPVAEPPVPPVVLLPAGVDVDDEAVLDDDELGVEAAGDSDSVEAMGDAPPVAAEVVVDAGGGSNGGDE